MTLEVLDMPQFLVVLFPHPRPVLINGESMGETNRLLELEGGRYRVTLGPPPDFTPAEHQIDLAHTAPLDPMQIEFKEKIKEI